MSHLLITIFRVWLPSVTRKFHKSFKALHCSYYVTVKYSELGLNGDIAIGFAACCISVSHHILAGVCTYSRSQNNVNVVYCNYKETNSSYNVITKCNSFQSLPIVGNIFKIFA